MSHGLLASPITESRDTQEGVTAHKSMSLLVPLTTNATKWREMTYQRVMFHFVAFVVRGTSKLIDCVP